MYTRKHVEGQVLVSIKNDIFLDWIYWQDSFDHK